MQSWFSDSLRFLPSAHLFPLFIGTHLIDKAQRFLLYFNSIYPAYFKDKEIGCRDLYTLDFCKKMGFNAYFSRCLTLTLPKREETKEQNQIFLTNLEEHHIALLPQHIKQNAIKINQREVKLEDSYSEESYFNKAQETLDLYKNKAKLVITSALHCAAPCVAMGIPTILIAKDEENFTRFSALDGILKIHTEKDLKEAKNYEVESKNIESLKQAMLKNLRLSINKLCKKEVDLKELQEIREFIANFKA
ncbi:MAG: polysaccharide pyruvyl transferase family protein [Helicobacteraceae bacterium]|nr:polysaccharide pyruvyl transferase family protein [Helicobacteraceae bacterium]